MYVYVICLLYVKLRMLYTIEKADLLGNMQSYNHQACI